MVAKYWQNSLIEKLILEEKRILCLGHIYIYVIRQVL